MKTLKRKESRGYTLIEVLVGILIFAVGMMALAQLQSHLARNSADANARTVAINIAEELIEQARVFSHIESTDSNLATYSEITSENLSRTGLDRGGISYDVTAVVTDYWFDYSTGLVTDEQPAGVPISDFKKVDLTVSWAEGQEFLVDQQNQSELGTGAIQISEVISSITSSTAGKVALNATGNTAPIPEVDYAPGQNPDVISIDLGNYKFKESFTPVPDVMRENELVETRFDVVTYSNPVNGDATFLRREEFLSVSCECVMADGDGGKRPTIWNGEEYVEGEFVDKPYGTEALGVQQSDYCDICCRDHHDGGTGKLDDNTDRGRSLYDPFRASEDYHTSGTLEGDHKHYNRDASGNPTLVSEVGQVYMEACRLVREDGFFRVAQDLRQEGLNAFPADYLDDDPDEIGEYSRYVTTAVSNYTSGAVAADNYHLAPPTMMAPSDPPLEITFPGSTLRTASLMSNSEEIGPAKQQLRSRGIYIDYLSSELQGRIHCLDAGGTGEECGVPKVSNALEIIPFYDVQLTWLASWNESPTDWPVSVSNDRISSDNQHSKGLAEVTSFGISDTSSAIHRGNLGLTGTDPIDERFSANTAQAGMVIRVPDPLAAPTSKFTIFGSITSGVGGVRAKDVKLVVLNPPTDMACDRTELGFDCDVFEENAVLQIRVENYFKPNKYLYACSPELGQPDRFKTTINPSERNYAEFELPSYPANVTIVIKEGGC